MGYDLPGPTILLGNPQDNPLIAHLTATHNEGGKLISALPYAVSADFPGRGHGMLAWNFASRWGMTSNPSPASPMMTTGMSEAVGTLFQLAIGIDPVTPLILPESNSVTPAAKRVDPTAASILWQTYLPDSVTALAIANGNTVAACDNDTSWSVAVGAAGKVTLKQGNRSDMPMPAKVTTDTGMLPKDALCPGLKVKQVLAGNGLIAVAYWGGRLQIFTAAGAVKTQQQLPEDITALAWNGDALVVGLADGCLLGLSAK